MCAVQGEEGVYLGGPVSNGERVCLCPCRGGSVLKGEMVCLRPCRGGLVLKWEMVCL